MLPKLLVVGHGRHGKDTVCEMLEAYGYTFQSSSKFCQNQGKFTTETLKVKGVLKRKLSILLNVLFLKLNI